VKFSAVAFCFVLLLFASGFAQSIESTAMTKFDFAEPGLAIVLPDDPNYGTEVQELGFSVTPFAYSGVLKNTHKGPSWLLACALPNVLPTDTLQPPMSRLVNLLLC
jgi:hypothetical protein